MKKKIAIYHNSEFILKYAYAVNKKITYGGTEFWVFKIAEELKKRFFDVTVFTDYFPNIKSDVDYQKRDSEKIKEYYDVFITTTDIEEVSSLNFNKLIIIPTCENFNKFLDISVGFDKIGFLSDYQEKLFIKNYSIDRSFCFRHFLPPENKFYDDSNLYKKENSMVWSSQPSRGLNFFIERIMPKIISVIPDFKLYVASYISDYERKNIKEIEYLGYCEHDKLAEIQKKAKIWIYPNIGRDEYGMPFHETFCITAVENALSENAIVCFDKGGISSTLKGYEGLIDGNIIKENNENFYIYNNYAAEALALQAINILKDEDYRKMLVAQAKNICKQYTWENEVQIIIKNI